MAHVYCFGDSITRGENDPVHGGWVDRLKRLYIGRFLNDGAREVCVFNLGIGGETTRSLKKRFLPELNARFDREERSIVVLAYGANDAARAGKTHLTPPGLYLANLAYCIRAAKRKDAKVLLLNITPVAAAVEGRPSASGKIRRGEFIGRYNAALGKLARANEVPLLDVHRAFVERGTGSLFNADGVHPNAKGHAVIYELVLAALTRVL